MPFNTISIDKFESTKPVSRRRWVDNIRMDLQEVGCGHVDWTGLGWPRIGTGGVRL